MNPGASEAIVIYNQDALEELAWAIDASQGQFSLLLARCNYAGARSRLAQRLQEICPVEIRGLSLKHSAHTLYTRIREDVEKNGQPAALMILGLEEVDGLEDMLPAVNSVREEFRKNFPFPIILWVKDDVHQTLVKLAPDFESWATTTDFPLPPDTLLAALQNASDRLFSTLLTPASNRSFLRLLQSLDFGFLHRSEMESALQDFRESGQVPPANLQATLDFVRGLNAPTNDAALEHFQRSLAYWQSVSNTSLPEEGRPANPEATGEPVAAPVPAPNSPSPHLITGLLLYFVGRTIYDICSENKYRQADWTPPKQPLLDAVQIFEQAHRPDLVAKTITQLERVLDRLGAWEELGVLAEKSLPLQRTYGDRSREAQDYRYLALVALHRNQPEEAHHFAQQALDANQEVPEDDRYRGLYLLVLAQTLRQQGQAEAAMTVLTEARHRGDQGIPRAYIAILEELRNCHLERKDYLKAFQLKQERLSVEQQYRLRAFIGAGRLQPQRQDQELLRVQAAVGRQPSPGSELPAGIASWQRKRDVKQLVERIGRSDRKLIVIHGYSGVGKSSLITAGLVPVLQAKAIGVQHNLPVVVRKYTDWVEELSDRLAEALAAIGLDLEIPPTPLEKGGDEPTPPPLIREGGGDPVLPQPTPPPLLRGAGGDPTLLIQQLRQIEQRSLRTVLIFDQFEEFFFVHTTQAQRRPFFEFLGQCLQLLSVKVILPLREDYLYYLLELNRIPAIQTTGIDILSQNVLYPLGNFSPQDARAIIQELTEQARFYLEPDLVQELVRDLTDENGEVRPIELQIVGAQLQTEEIREVEAYCQLRQVDKPAKEVLVERYLADVVADCGAENKRAAELVLYLLTSENNTRPLKTKAELAADMGDEAARLDLVLEILAHSGLVMLLPETPEDRYQLVHDYLVPYIRREQGEDLLEELKAERVQRKLSDAKLKRFLKRALVISVVAGLGLAGLAAMAISVARQADVQRKRAEIGEFESLNKSSELLSDAGRNFEALMDGFRAAKRLKQADWKTPDDQIRTTGMLQQAIYNIQERNSLDLHRGVVTSVSFSPDGKTLASGSWDNTVKLWSAETGRELKTFPAQRSGTRGHTDGINGISFSPDGKMIASGSWDATIKLWSVETGKELKTLKGHTAAVLGMSFSPDGKTLVSTSRDNTVKLWSVETGKELTAKGHTDAIGSVDFSPDGKAIAIASGDKTVKLWSVETGKELKTLKGHTAAVNRVSFSPDGTIIASTSEDKTVKLWSVETGKELKTLKGHTAAVLGMSFSPDGKTLASASWDTTVILWSVATGEQLTTLKGHKGGVMSVGFRPVHGLSSQDAGKILATASYDNTVKLWSLEDKPFNTLPAKPSKKQGHTGGVWGVSFSPDGKTLASASRDKTVKVWSVETGKELKTLKGHIEEIWDVSFSPDGKTLASASLDKTVKVWSVETGKPLKNLNGHMEAVYGVSFSPDGNMLASSSGDKTVKLWNVETGKELKTLKGHTNGIRSANFSPDGKTLASASWDKTVKLWSVETGKELKTLKGHTRGVLGVSFSPDGKTVATASDDNTVKLWSVATGKELKTLKGHTAPILRVRFSLDGKTIASISSDTTVKLWSAETGKELKTLKGHTDAVLGLSFSPNGKMIATGSDDGTVKLWNLNFEDLVGQGCRWLNKYLATHPDALEEFSSCQTQSLWVAAVSTWVTKGDNLAREGRLDEAISLYHKAQTRDPNLKFDPQVKAQQLLNQGDAKQLIDESASLAQRGEVKAALAALSKAQTLDPTVEILVDDWDSLCWYGSLNGSPREVLFACEKSVAMAPGDELGYYRDSRGVARALLGDGSGAIQDFQSYVRWSKDNDKKARRQRWIDSLRRAPTRNPFTPEDLEYLRF